jgi:thioredoxin reductase (NADPH)
VAIGHDPNTKYIANLLDTDEAGYLIPQSRLPHNLRTSKYNMATEIPGIFVAGDVEDHEYRQAITAAAGGCRAAMECEKWLAE